MSLRTKIVTILVVFIVFFGLGVYPILSARYRLPAPAWLQAHQLKLGLDLKGGVHLVLRVQTDDALRLQTDQSAEQLREALRMRNIMVTGVTTPSISQIRVDGVAPAQDAAFRDAAAELAASFDRSPG